MCVPDPTHVHPPPPTVDAGHWQIGPLLGTVVVIVTVWNEAYRLLGQMQVEHS